LVLSVDRSQGETAFSDVLGEAAGLGELFVTAAAFKLSLPGVDRHVLVQLGMNGKAAWAQLTLEPKDPRTPSHLNKKQREKLKALHKMHAKKGNDTKLKLLTKRYCTTG
jgi:hypothetical protein